MQGLDLEKRPIQYPFAAQRPEIFVFMFNAALRARPGPGG